MSPETTAVLDQLERAMIAALALTRALVAAQSPDDQWLRMPPVKGRCQVSQWSRSKIARLIASGQVRGKRVGGSAFYSAADVRALLSQNQNQTNAAN